VIEEGLCVGKCSPELCTIGNTCVGNRCVLTCDSHDDCYAGFDCTPSVEDDTGATITTCQPSTKAALLGEACYFGTECDAATVCPDGTLCGGSLCGGQACTDGACPDGTACTPQSCDEVACRSPWCVGAVGGESPTGQSYCAQLDCTADTDCAAGMYCGVVRDFHEICGKTIELGSQKPCIDPADFTTDGKTYQEGSVSLLRNSCLLRKQCAPCATDLDCAGKAGQLCSILGGESRCAATCLTDDDCEADSACQDDPAHPGTLVCTPRYGSCTGDAEFCSPCVSDLDCGGPETSGLCSSTTGGRSCIDYSFSTTCEMKCPDGTACDQFLCGTKPCVDGVCQANKACNADPCDGEPCVDSRCPDDSYCNADPCNGDLCENGVCPNTTACVEQNCTNAQCRGDDTACPLSVDGLHHGECFDKDEGYRKSDFEYGRCYLPYYSGPALYQCWAP
jgi:hypothetical protein